MPETPAAPPELLLKPYKKQTGIPCRYAPNLIKPGLDLRCPKSRKSLDDLDTPGHHLPNLGIELGRRAARETYLFGEVVRQYVKEIAIVLLVEERCVRELDVVVAAGLGTGCRDRWRLVGDGEVEMES